MAKQDKETYDSYEKDVYDNPPAGPMGVHRGARSAASRAMPYVIVIIVALLAGLLFWGVYSGEINNLKVPWSSQESPTTSSAEKSKNSGSKSKSQSDSASGNKTDTSNTDSPADSPADSQQNDQNADQNADQTDNTTAQQVVNTGTEVRVVNATNITGYAQSKVDVLAQAGYTSVSASNPTGNVPSQTVVWYQNETDKATAENVAQTLGISNVQQSDGLVTPIVVVLLD